MVGVRASRWARLACLACVGAALAACGDDGSSASEGSGAGGTGAGGTAAGDPGVGGSGGTGEGGAGGNGGHCAASDPVVTAEGPGAYRVQTEHYDLYVEAGEARAAELGKLVESAYGELVERFEIAPPTASGERLEGRYYATFDAFVAGMMADGVMASEEAAGYFDPGTRRFYVSDQPSPYYDQVLLLHEAVHQFHLLGRAAGTSLPFWYVEGLAEHLGRHDWDGACVRLGVLPTLSWEDLPADALALEQGAGLEVGAIVDGSAGPSRPAAWALTHFLDRGDDGAHRAAFDAFRAQVDTTGDASLANFTALVGDPTQLGGSLSAWLPTSQEPMRPVYTEWTHVGPGEVVGESPGVFSIAVTRQSPAHFETRYAVPDAAAWSAGLVLGYDAPGEFSALVVDSTGALRTFTATNGGAVWGDAGTAPATLDDGTGELVVDRAPDGMLQVRINGAQLDFTSEATPRPGLAIHDARVRFFGIASD
jgi:hypothetical protein